MKQVEKDGLGDGQKSNAMLHDPGENNVEAVIYKSGRGAIELCEKRSISCLPSSRIFDIIVGLISISWLADWKTS